MEEAALGIGIRGMKRARVVCWSDAEPDVPMSTDDVMAFTLISLYTLLVRVACCCAGRLTVLNVDFLSCLKR